MLVHRYIDPSVSYLSFKVRTIGAAGAVVVGTMRTANGISFLRETIVRSRTGVELSRSVGHDLSRFHIQNYRVDQGYYSTVGAAMHNASDAGRVDIASGADTHFCIPLSDVNPFFSTSTLLPSDLGQLRVEINLNPFGTVFGAGAPVGYIVSDVRVMCKVYELSDTALKRLTFIASQTGLTIPFTDCHQSIVPCPNSSINAVSLKSASRGLVAFACIVDTAHRNDVTQDSGKLRTYGENDWFQFSLGSAFVTSEPIRGIEEAHIQANDAFGLWGRANDNVSNMIRRQDFAGGYGVMSCNLERSAVLQYNGSAVSSSRPLLLQAQVTALATSECHLFLNYLRLCVVFSDSNIVLLE